jgi:hypothetical protein
MEPAQLGRSGESLVGDRRLVQRLLAAQLGDGVQLGIDSLDPTEDGLSQLAGRDLPASDELGCFDGGTEDEVGQALFSSSPGLRTSVAAGPSTSRDSSSTN